MKLSLIKANPGSLYGEETEFAIAKSFDGATISLSNDEIKIVSLQGDNYVFNLIEWEEDYFYSTKKSTYSNGKELRILQTKMKSLGDNITFASMFGNGYAVHYDKVNTDVENQHISDHQDSMSGHVCGNTIVDASSPWKERYDTLQEEREELLAKMRQLSLFETARQKMYSTLKQDGKFEIAMQENREIIKSNREGKIHPAGKFGLAMIGIGVILLAVGGVLGNNLIMGIGGIVAGTGVVLGIGGLAASTEQSLVNNQYITNFLTPFIEGHRKDYSDAGVNNYTQGILESEIIEPEEISKKISQKIEELTNKIEDIDHQVQLMRQMN